MLKVPQVALELSWSFSFLSTCCIRSAGASSYNTRLFLQLTVSRISAPQANWPAQGAVEGWHVLRVYGKQVYLTSCLMILVLSPETDEGNRWGKQHVFHLVLLLYRADSPIRVFFKTWLSEIWGKND